MKSRKAHFTCRVDCENGEMGKCPKCPFSMQSGLCEWAGPSKMPKMQSRLCKLAGLCKTAGLCKCLTWLGCPQSPENTTLASLFQPLHPASCALAVLSTWQSWASNARPETLFQPLHHARCTQLPLIDIVFTTQVSKLA
jgi:hypothetical protein